VSHRLQVPAHVRLGLEGPMTLGAFHFSIGSDLLFCTSLRFVHFFVAHVLVKRGLVLEVPFTVATSKLACCRLSHSSLLILLLGTM